jgi:F-type H+-transporting ATPase subunit a
MNVFVWVIEVFSLLLRPITLAIRLFCNMFAGHIVMGSFSIMAALFAEPLLEQATAATIAGAIPSIAWLAILLIIYAVELIVAFVQAYVFTVLSAVYIQIAEADGH